MVADVNATDEPARAHCQKYQKLPMSLDRAMAADEKTLRQHWMGLFPQWAHSNLSGVFIMGLFELIGSFSHSRTWAHARPSSTFILENTGPIQGYWYLHICGNWPTQCGRELVLLTTTGPFKFVDKLVGTMVFW
jgi:hypothetical protein